MTRTKPLSVLAAVALGLAVAPVAHAAESADTTLSVTIDVGTLSISAPATASLGTVSAAVGSTKSAKLGAVTVADTRGSLVGWSVTAFTTTEAMSNTASPPDTIALSATGPLSWATGTVTAVGGSLLSGVGAGGGGNLSKDDPITVALAAGAAGGGTYTYDPTLTLIVPANTASGTYSVVITQTVV